MAEIHELSPKNALEDRRQFDRDGGNGAPPVAPPPGDKDLRNFIYTLKRGKKIILATFLVVTSLAALITSQLTPRYSAEALVSVNSRQTNVVNIEDVVTGMTADNAEILSEVEVIKSRSLAEAVVTLLKLENDPEFNSSLRKKGFFSQFLSPSNLIPESWKKAMRENEQTPTQSEEAIKQRHRSGIISAFQGHLMVVPVARSRVIRISFQSENPEKAAQIANTVADQYILSQLEGKFDATRKASDWLNDQLVELRETVRRSEAEVEAYRSQQNLKGDQGTEVTSQQLTEVNSQLVQAKSQRAEAEARLRQIRTLLGKENSVESATEVINSPLIQKLKEQETEVLRSLSELSNRYGERHPKMINIKSELRDLRSKIQSEVGKIAQGLENELRIAGVRERSLQSSLNDLTKKRDSSNTSDIKLRELQRDAEANRVLYETFLTRFKETTRQEEIQEADARVISRADTPTSPAYPKVRLIIFLAAVSSIFLGVGLVLFLERLDNGLRNPDQVEALTGYYVLGMLPLAKGVKGRGAADYIIEKPASALSEAMRSLKTALSLAGGGTGRDAIPKTLCITSSVPNEGKTNLCAWLARTAAASDLKVILVDCDLRRPRMANCFNAKADKTLPDILTAKVPWTEAVLADPESGLHLIFGANVQENALNLVNSPQMEVLLSELKQHYDLVILDAPPTLPVSDSGILSRLCEKVIFVVKWDETPSEVVQSGIRNIRDLGGQIAGVVLTQVNLKKHVNYGYGDTGTYYGRYKEYYAD